MSRSIVGIVINSKNEFLFVSLPQDGGKFHLPEGAIGDHDTLKDAMRSAFLEQLGASVVPSERIVDLIPRATAQETDTSASLAYYVECTLKISDGNFPEKTSGVIVEWKTSQDRNTLPLTDETNLFFTSYKEHRYPSVTGEMEQ